MSTGHSQRARVTASAFVDRLALVLLVVSVALNLFQARQLKAFTSAPAAGLQPGTRVPPLPLKTLRGRPLSLAFEGRPTILYYFSPTCAWCEKNWLNVKALAAATDDQYRFVGVSTDRNIEAFAIERGLTFELFAEPDPEVKEAFQLRGTPQTIVISATGVVEYTWRGAYGPPQQKAIERAFGVLLPGLGSVNGN